MKRAAIFQAIAAERTRQMVKHPGHTIADDSTELYKKLAILVEEVGEVSRAMLDGKPDDMRKELVEVAACAVGWLESLN